ncbi:MAG: carbohydrate ABC transporter permease [Devosia sp.]|jgi:ABC-type sugar transport system permease subunit|nr:sugar ABC transporter permease [Devosiaceae bacterium]
MTTHEDTREDGAAIARAEGQPRRWSLWLRDNYHWYLFIAPAVLLLLAFMGFPLYRSLELSLFQWKGLLPRKWAGLHNFEQLFADGYFWSALSHTIVFAIAATVGTVGLGFLLAVAISRRVPLHSLYRFAFYLPVMLPMTVVAALWARIYEPNFGLLNTALKAIGLGALAQPWLGSLDLSLPAIIAVVIWQYAGFPMIVLLAAIEGVPEELHQAATLDGASELDRMRYLIVPMIWPVLVSISVIQIIFSLKVFDIVWVMTKGGPAESSSVLGTYLYRRAFEQQEYGYASAVAVAMFAVIFTVTYLYYRLSKVDAVEF